MSEKLRDTLDLVLERLRTGEPISSILTDYPAEAEQLGPLLETAASLDNIPPVKLPAQAEFQADRADFLVHVTDLQQQAVSPGLFGRLKEGIVHPLPWLTLGVAHSEGRQRRMSTLAIKVMLVFGLLFGSAGATAAMAANSLPDSPLYPVKLAMEDARLAVTTSPAQQAQLHLAMARERSREITQQALNGDLPEEPTLHRLQQHLNYALQLASQLPDEEMAGVLTQAQEMAQTQTQYMAQVQAQVGEPAQERLGFANRLLNQVGREAEGGLEDPLAFRNRFGHNRPSDEPAPPEPPLPLEGAEPVPVQNPDVNPDCPAGDCPQNQYQHGQESDTLPGRYGQPCDTEDCVPAGDQNQHQYGQEEPDPGSVPGEHGNQCQAGGEGCEAPFGEEHKYGQGSDETNGPPEDAGCGEECGSSGGNQNQNQEQLQEQNQEQLQEQEQEQQQTGPNGNDDNGQDVPLIAPGGASAGGDGSSSGGSDSNGTGAKNGGGGKKN